MFGILDEFKKKKLFARFCKENEVLEKNQIFLNFKGKFLAQMKQIEQNGQKIKVQKKLEKWIEDNQDEMYDQMLE